MTAHRFQQRLTGVGQAPADNEASGVEGEGEVRETQGQRVSGGIPYLICNGVDSQQILYRASCCLFAGLLREASRDGFC